MNLILSSVSRFRSCSLLLLIPEFGYDGMTGLAAFSLKEMEHRLEREKHSVQDQNRLNFDEDCGSNVDDDVRERCSLTPYTYATGVPLE